VSVVEFVAAQGRGRAIKRNEMAQLVDEEMAAM